MIVKSASATYEGSGLRFAARTGSGHTIVLDDSSGDGGPRPVEMLLVGQAGCTGMDVISILQKKRQQVTRYEVSVSAEQRTDPHPAIFTRAEVVHQLEGPGLDEAAVRRAIELSATKYCSVAAMLSAGTVEIHHRYRIARSEGGDTLEGEVLVTGPLADPDSLGAPRRQETVA